MTARDLPEVAQSSYSTAAGSSVAPVVARLTANIERVMRGQGRATRWLLAGLVAGAHVLLEDLPGTGKTTLAKALARSEVEPLRARIEDRQSQDVGRQQIGPGDFHGTYPLPEAQMDRFALAFPLGYISIDDEMALIDDQADSHPVERIAAQVTLDEILALRRACNAVHLNDDLKRYIATLVAATRTANGVRLGASPRATLHLARIARALAAFDGLDYVTPDHVQEVAAPALAHRIALEPQAKFAGATGERIVAQLLDSTVVPA